jgi:hypothetical protein
MLTIQKGVLDTVIPANYYYILSFPQANEVCAAGNLNHIKNSAKHNDKPLAKNKPFFSC